jgi:hypothetical protein
MFEKFNATLKAADATAIVTKALHTFATPLARKPDNLAKNLVGHVCGVRPDLFGFGRTPPPHPVATAAFSLAYGVAARDEFSLTLRNVMFMALGAVMMDALENRYRYDLDDKELGFISSAHQHYIAFMEEQIAATQAAETAAQEDAITAPIPSLNERLANLAQNIGDFEHRRGHG